MPGFVFCDRRKSTYTVTTGVLIVSLFILISCNQTLSAGEPNGLSKATVLPVNAPFNRENLLAVRRQIDRAVEQDVQTIIFSFSGRGLALESYSDLARDIARLGSRKSIQTIAYIPNQALGTTMLGVFACQVIVVDEFAQLGQVIAPVSLRTEGQESAPPPFDTETLVNKISSFARAAGHEEKLARAMTDKRMILYQIARDGQTKFVDQAGFERYVQHTTPPWAMVGPGPLVTSDSVLLLDGQKALELGLAAYLADNEEELAEKLKLSIIKILPAETAEQEGPADANDVTQPVEMKELIADKPPKAVVITCADMIDEGLYASLRRRTEAAIEAGATHIVYEIDTFGGRVDSAIAISNYFTHEVASRAHTIAYIPTEAFSAGALISVACNDIIMKKGTKIGDCAPILLQGKLEGVEREKAESPLRAIFTSSAETNGYPVALCKAMVTAEIAVYQVKNLITGKNEYFESEQLPKDPYSYDLEGKKLIVKAGELATFTAEQAYEYGLNRALVNDREGALAFIEKRDHLAFSRPVETLETNWSEELVRWLTSPTIAGLLLMVALLGIYIELNTPGVGLPGVTALVALAILFGSKYLIGLANWWEIALFFLGLALLLVEIFVIPGFGVTGISGIVLILFSLGAMMVSNRPDEWPIPKTDQDWSFLQKNLIWTFIGFFLFILSAYFIGRHLPHIPLANRLILQPPVESEAARAGGVAAPAAERPVKVGETGVTLSPLRPAGNARFGSVRLGVVTRGELVDAQKEITVVAIEGNSIVVKERL